MSRLATNETAAAQRLRINAQYAAAVANDAASRAAIAVPALMITARAAR